MTNPDKAYEYRVYLDDLSEILTEHDETCHVCANPEKYALCVFKATVTVEIVTYRRKLEQIV
jgi:hypothetical protein